MQPALPHTKPGRNIAGAHNRNSDAAGNERGVDLEKLRYPKNVTQRGTTVAYRCDVSRAVVDLKAAGDQMPSLRRAKWGWGAQGCPNYQKGLHISKHICQGGRGVFFKRSAIGTIAKPANAEALALAAGVGLDGPWWGT